MSRNPTTAKAAASPAPKPEPGVPTPISVGYARKLATAVEVAEHETRMAAEMLEVYARRLRDAADLLLRDLAAERASETGHTNVRDSNSLGLAPGDYERALASYIAKRDALATLQRLLTATHPDEPRED